MRLFTAIELDQASRDALAGLISRLSAARGDLRIGWTAPENQHLTLTFLGDAEPSRLPEIHAACGRAAHDVQPFTMFIKRCGAFPSADRPRIIWAGVDGPPSLGQLADLVAGELYRIGFPREERSFSPHVTIGRVREERRPKDGAPPRPRKPAAQAASGIADAIAKEQGFDGGAVAVGGIVIVQSDIGSEGGARYSIVGKIPLGV